MDRRLISPTRIVDLSHITSVEQIGKNVVVRWSNGDKELIQGDAAQSLWIAWSEEYRT